MKKIILMIVLSIVVLVGCSKEVKDEDLIKEFIELNYNDYEEDVKEYNEVDFENLEGTAFLGLHDENTEPDKTMEDEIPQIYKKYKKYFDKEYYETILISDILGGPGHLDIVDNVKISKLNIILDKENNEEKIYNVKFTAECNLDNKSVYSEEINTKITVNNGKIVEMTNYYSPIIVALNYKYKNGL